MTFKLAIHFSRNVTVMLYVCVFIRCLLQGGTRYILNEGIIDEHLNVGCILGLGVAPLLTPRIISPAMSQHFRKPQSQENVSKYTKIEP